MDPMTLLAYGLMAAGGAIFVFNWWRIMREGYQLQQMTAPGGGLSSRWRFFLMKAIYAFLGFAAILAGVLISKGGQG